MIRFEDVQKSLHHQAWVANNMYPSIPFEEFVSAGHEIFIKCLGKYNKTKGARFNSYFTASCKKFFKGMISKAARNNNSINVSLPEPELQSYESQNTLTPEALVIFKDIIINLPEDAKIVCELVFTDPNLCNKGAIRHYLRNIWHGQDIQERISTAFRCIRKSLKNY